MLIDETIEETVEKSKDFIGKELGHDHSVVTIEPKPIEKPIEVSKFTTIMITKTLRNRLKEAKGYRTYNQYIEDILRL